MPIPLIALIQDAPLVAQLQTAINHKNKPQGSLGVLEQLALQIGLIQGTLKPVVGQPCIILFAGDHGVALYGVSAYPQSITWQMVENVLAGGAAINVFAHRQGADLLMVDAGVNHDFGCRPNLIDRKVRYGTRHFVLEPAMTTEECWQAIEQGMALVAGLGREPGRPAPKVLGLGEMGIGNSTSAAALMHRLTGFPVSQCVGEGTGLTARGILHKQQMIEAAMAHHADVVEPLDVLATFGGFEIAMMVGAMLQAASQRQILLIDGFIATSALLVAARLQPAVLDYCIFCHCSSESGHGALLHALSARPLLNLDMSLGEGTGCALALPLVHAAVDMLNEMAAFGAQAESPVPRSTQ